MKGNVTMRPVYIKVNNEIFPSIVEAAKFLNYTAPYVGTLLKQGVTEIDGKVVSKATEEEIKTYNEEKAKYKVVCITTGKYYKTITAAAQDANCNDWTMSIKLEQAGKFIDKEGNEYHRLIPMKRRSSNELPVQLPYIARNITRHSKTLKNTKTEVLNTNIETSIEDDLCNIGKCFVDNKQYDKAIRIFDILKDLNAKVE